MARPVVLSNGQLFVGLDENGLVHDFYYPYVGLDNLTNARSAQHKIGVWVNGDFSWTNDGSWNIQTTYEQGTLTSRVIMRSERLGVTLQTHDFVDDESNVFVRSIEVTNDRDNERDIRVFMHQVFQIGRNGRADTAMYVPEDDYILDYKGHCCLLIAGKISKNPDGSVPADPAKVDDDNNEETRPVGTFDQYSVGSYGIEGKAGTFMDAEDGELTNNAIEHGGVDSVIRFQRVVTGHASFMFDYWVIAADSQTDAQLVHTKLKYYPVSERSGKVQSYWKQWLATSDSVLQPIDSSLRSLTETSLLVIKAHCDRRGSILASGDSSIFNFGRDYYCYCWPRDAAYAIWPLLRCGQFSEAKAFFEFARDTLHHDGYLMHKYQPDRAIGSTWHPLVHGRSRELAIQEDETAIVVCVMGEYFKRTRDRDFVASYYESFIAPAAQFMSTYIDESTGLPHASYDLWEEKFLTNTYTVSTVIGALETAGRLAEVVGRAGDAFRWQEAADKIRGKLHVLYHPDGYFRKGFLLQPNGDLVFDDVVDISSLFGPYAFAGLSLSDPQVASTLKHVEKKLLNTSPVGGVIRYEGDNYFRAKRQYSGNPWIVCSLWLAQLYVGAGRREEADRLLKWVQERALPSGALSEQFDPEDGHPISVTPLVWSHAELINTALDLHKMEAWEQ
jgi:GH15 family glucan-1,4-alpha-glucosidase